MNGEDTLKFNLLHKLSKHFNYSKIDPSEVDTGENEPSPASVGSTSSQLIQPDQYNHVSYSFSFFLHGSSRVCTSVDMKLHRPIRLLNTSDLFRLKTKMNKMFATPVNEFNALPNSMIYSEKSSGRKIRFTGK